MNGSIRSYVCKRAKGNSNFSSMGFDQQDEKSEVSNLTTKKYGAVKLGISREFSPIKGQSEYEHLAKTIKEMSFPNSSKFQELVHTGSNLVKQFSEINDQVKCSREIAKAIPFLPLATTQELSQMAEKFNGMVRVFSPLIQRLNQLGSTFPKVYYSKLKNYSRILEMCPVIINTAQKMTSHRDEGELIPIFFLRIFLRDMPKKFLHSDQSVLNFCHEFLLKDDNLYRILAEWCRNPLYKERREILHDAVVAHMAGKHTLSIPIFLIQTEGILGEIFKQGSLKKIKKEMTKKIKTIKKCPKSEHREIYYLLNVLIKQVYISSYGEAGKSYPCRGRILHGRDTQYYKKKYDSTRCIIILDLLNLINKER